LIYNFRKLKFKNEIEFVQFIIYHAGIESHNGSGLNFSISINCHTLFDIILPQHNKKEKSKNFDIEQGA
jgi:hypothetical protein